jgi:hypothetical protein
MSAQKVVKYSDTDVYCLYLADMYHGETKPNWNPYGSQKGWAECAPKYVMLRHGNRGDSIRSKWRLLIDQDPQVVFEGRKRALEWLESDMFALVANQEPVDHWFKVELPKLAKTLVKKYVSKGRMTSVIT